MDEAVGNREAVERVVRDHARWVFAAARRRVRDGTLAEDVTQAVFLLYWRKGVRVEGEGKLAGWLYRAVRYCSANALRLQKIQQRHEREAAMQRQQDHQVAAGWCEIEVELEGAMDRLSEKDRQAVVLRFYRGLSLREVGEALGLGEDAARMRVERAVGRLRERLAARGVEAQSLGLSGLILVHAAEGGPAGLVERTMAGIGQGMGSSTAGGIAQGAARMITLARVKIVAGIVLGMAVAGGIAASAATKGPVPAKSGSATIQPMREALQLADLSKEQRMHIRELSLGRASGGPQSQDIWYVRGKGLASVAKWPGREVVLLLDENGTGWKYRVGRDVVGRTAEKTTASQEQARMLQRMMSMQDQNPVRDPAGDRVVGGVMSRCFRLKAGPDASAQSIWIDAANRIVASKSDSSEVEITYDDVAPANLFSTDWGKGVEVIDSGRYLPNQYPLDKAVVVREIGRSVFAVHEYGRDAGGCYYLICSTRPAKGQDSADATEADAAQPWLSGFVGNTRPVKRLGYIPREIASTDSWDQRVSVKWYLVTPDPATQDTQGTLQLWAGIGTTRSDTPNEGFVLDFRGKTPTVTTAAEFAGKAWTEVDRLWPALQAGYCVVTYGENGKGSGVTNPREPGELPKDEFLQNVATQIERARK